LEVIDLEKYDLPAPTLQGLAYVLFTSGTTGVPKGVCVSNQNLTHYIDHALSTYYERENIGSVLLSSISFDGTLPNVFLPLATGGSVFIPDSNRLYESAAEYLEKSNAVFLKVTPSQIRVLISTIDVLESGSHTVVLGGEQVFSELANELLSKFPNSKIYNHYGPTETTIGCTLHQIKNDFKCVPLGKPNLRTQIYIVDSHDNLVPRGVIGEILIGGHGVSSGYLNQDELTAQKFIKNKLFPIDRHKVYRSGDLGKYLDDGTILYYGRNDDQVKIRGLRIELQEITTRILSFNNVESCYTTSYKNENSEIYIVSYVCMEKSVFDQDQIYDYLKDKLPDYMLPTSLIRLDEFTLNQNGKIDATSLPLPDIHLFKSVEYVEPSSETEVKLAEIWMGILSYEKVGRYDDFFDLGGHSLLATILLSRARTVFDIDLSLSTIFENSKLHDLAKAITDLQISEYEIKAVRELEDELENISDNELLKLLEAEEQ